MRGIRELNELSGRDARDITRPAPACSHEALHPDKELLAARLLLLLLGDGMSYGYELRREMRDRRLQIDSGNLYRWLRRLEREGSVHSRWTRSEVGPQRRSYRLTAKGRRTLEEIAGLISRIRDTQDAFLEAYEPAQRGGAAHAV